MGKKCFHGHGSHCDCRVTNYRYTGRIARKIGEHEAKCRKANVIGHRGLLWDTLCCLTCGKTVI
jgi:hypothetical protein